MPLIYQAERVLIPTLLVWYKSTIILREPSSEKHGYTQTNIKIGRILAYHCRVICFPHQPRWRGNVKTGHGGECRSGLIVMLHLNLVCKKYLCHAWIRCLISLFKSERSELSSILNVSCALEFTFVIRIFWDDHPLGLKMWMVWVICIQLDLHQIWNSWFEPQLSGLSWARFLRGLMGYNWQFPCTGDGCITNSQQTLKSHCNWGKCSSFLLIMKLFIERVITCKKEWTEPLKSRSYTRKAH